VCCSVLQCVAVCCCVLLCVAVCCCVLQHPRFLLLTHIYMKGDARVLQCVAVCCSVLQCVAVCCSVLVSSFSLDIALSPAPPFSVARTHLLPHAHTPHTLPPSPPPPQNEPKITGGIFEKEREEREMRGRSRGGGEQGGAGDGWGVHNLFLHTLSPTNTNVCIHCLLHTHTHRTNRS